MAENTQKTTKSRMDAKQTLEALNKISRSIENKDISSKFIIATECITGVENFRDDALELYNTIREKYDICVDIIEKVDIKDVSKETRYIIRLRDMNSNYIEFDLNEYRNNLMDFEFNPFEFIENQLLRLLGAFNKNTVECTEAIVKYISLILNDKGMYTLLYNSIGWEEINSHMVFKYDELVTDEKYLRGEFNDDLKFALQETDPSNEWLEKARVLFENEEHIKAALVLCAAVSGVVRQLLTYSKETNINMNIVGDRATGKSSLQHFVLSFFGKPGKIEGSFIDTVNAAEINRLKLSVIPYMLDERLLRYYESTEKRKRIEIMMDIFREYEGKGKERLSGKYANMSGQRTVGAIISSSVERIMDSLYDYEDFGQFRRFIEIEVDENDTFDDGEMAAKYEKIANDSYGVGIKMLVEYIIKERLYEKDKISRRFDVAVKRVGDVYGNLNLFDKYDTEYLLDDMESSKSRFGLIYLTGQLINEAFGWEIDLEEMMVILKNNLIEKLLIVETKKKRVNISTPAISIKDFIKFVFEDYKKFFTYDMVELARDDGKYIGYIENNGKEIFVRFLAKGRNYRALSICGVNPEEQLKGCGLVDKKAERVFFEKNSKYIKDWEKDRDRISPKVDGKQKHTKTRSLILDRDALIRDGILTEEEGE